MSRIVLAESRDRYFLLNRAPLGEALQRAGFRVAVVGRETGSGDLIRERGFDFFPWPPGELGLPLHFFHLYRRLRPRLVHHFTFRPVLYGALSARCWGIPHVNSLTGLGYAFTEKGRRPLLRAALSTLCRLALRSGHTIVQNPDDQAYVREAGWAGPGRLHLVPGSGVDVERFRPTPEPPEETLRVLLPGRLLADKGVHEFVAAARQARAVEPRLRFVLVGEPDEFHPTSIARPQLEGWVREGVVEWAGFVQDMPGALAESHIVVLPSYREGFPKALLEACACGRAVVGADVPGVREVVIPERTGLLVPVRDSAALAEAVLRLAGEPELRRRLGQGGRELAERHSQAAIVAALLEVYQRAGVYA